jgi:hypothetical protein
MRRGDELEPCKGHQPAEGTHPETGSGYLGGLVAEKDRLSRPNPDL